MAAGRVNRLDWRRALVSRLWGVANRGGPMAIHCRCKCGARIRVPDSAAGKRARCRSCGAVFAVPPASGKPKHTPSPANARRQAEPAKAADDRYSWLEEFAHAESDTRGQPPVTIITDASDGIDLSDATPPPRPTGDDGYPSPDEERSGVVGPQQPFWRDLIESFVFFLDPSNLVTVLVLTFIPLVLSCIPVLGWGLNLIVQFYIVAFYMEIVRETASGSDQLPEILWITGVVDLLRPFFQFLGTVAWVLLPAMLVAGWSWANDVPVPWRLVIGLVGAGLLFWPVVVLEVAIGGRLAGLWPHTTIRTALSAPLAYLAICAAILVAAALRIIPNTAWFQSLTTPIAPGLGTALAVLDEALGMYAMIVAMRVIGLFYRHYKHKFPWAAE